MTRNPLVSIIIPTYNRSALLLETLQSVIDQTYKNWECIVVDDGSDEDTPVVVNKRAEKESRINYFIRPEEYPKGACGSRNFGLTQSKGEFIQFLDDDDLLSNNKLELQVKNLLSINNKNVFTTCDWDVYWEGKDFEPKNIFDEEEIILHSQYLNKIRKKESFVPCHTFLIPRNVVKAAGEWNTNLRINDDAEFVIRVLLNSKYLVNTKNCYALYRTHNAKRISLKFSLENTKSLLYSYRLMHAHLLAYSINNRNFFKWKLRRIIIAFWKTDRSTIIAHKYFFQENGLNLKWVNFYLARNEIYKRAFPVIKKYLNK